MGKPAAGPYRNGLIAFVRCCGPETGIYVIRADGAGEHRIYAPAGDDAPLGPAWSPNGRQIAFVPGAPRVGVWVMQANGTERHRITAGKGDRRNPPATPSWSPRPSDRLLELGDLYAVRTNGTRLRRLTRTAAEELSPAWAANGAEIVYDRGFDLWQMKPDGSAQHLLAQRPARHRGRRQALHIAFIGGGDRG